MPALADIRKVSLATVIILAMVTVLLPLCMMIGCGMGFTEMMGSPVLGLSSSCVNTMTTGAQVAISSGSPLSLILLMLAVVGGALLLLAPSLDVRPLRAVADNPPDPPADPRGVRLII